ncbi:hypothetical protein [Desulforamulus hydrothermalis]|uniref:hypothetical protein n=1 Tax=Desulforamulus hydrothermalis TaxID=412895 RepID=UPI00135F146F|nr:hypothetical protein [Desulforamulus hydrothermalis]
MGLTAAAAAWVGSPLLGATVKPLQLQQDPRAMRALCRRPMTSEATPKSVCGKVRP